MPKKIKVKAKVSSKKKGATEKKVEKNIKNAHVEDNVAEAIIKEVPKMSVITPNQVASKYNRRLKVYTKAAA